MNRKVTANLLFAAVILAVIVVVIIVGLLKTDPEEIIQGETEATSYRVSSKVPGRVAEIRFEEGDLVKKGDTLAILEAPDIMAKLSQANAAYSAAKAIEDKAQKGARQEQIQGAFEMWQKAKAGLELAKATYERAENLYKEGVIAAQKRDEAKANYDAMSATEKAAKSQYDMAVNGAEEEVKDMAAAQMRQAQGVVAEVNSYIEETVLTATLDGEVSEIFPMVGELVGTGAPIMNIAVMEDMWVSFNVREDLLQDLTMGAVRDAYIPAIDKTVPVKVTYMRDLGSYAAWKATKVNGQYDLKTFEVRAVPQEKVENLRPGMTVIIDRK